MKKVLLVVFIALFTASSFSQTQLENPGFEGTWSTTGVEGSEPEPAEWSSLKSADALAAFAPIVAFQETNNPHSGTYCIRLLVVNSFGVNAAGVLTNGRVHADFNPELGYVFTEPSDSIWHLEFNDRPDSLTFWVRHDPQNGDKSKFEVVLHDDSYPGTLPHDGTTSHWVGKARADITTTITTWTRVSVPFIYYNDSIPDYCLATMSAGDSTIAEQNTAMWIDDIALIYNPLSVSVDPAGQQTIDACTNGTTLTVTENINAATVDNVTREWKWSNTPGGPYNSFTVPETGTSYTPNFTSINDFYIICESDFGSQGVFTSNEVQITTVSGAGNIVSITPVATQNINANQDGTDLTAIECPNATSREWMWTTTSGSGYQSFTPIETDSVYTPNFTAAGTYYVTCESDFSGDIQTSNEVTIIVAPEGTGFDEDNVKFSVFNNGSGIQVDYENAQEFASFEIFTLEGKNIYRSQLPKGTSTHQVNAETGVYIFRIINGNQIITGKVNL